MATEAAPEEPGYLELMGDLDDLAELLHACVHGGASVNFVLPFSLDDAASYWRDQAFPAKTAGRRRILLIRAETRIVGSVQLDLHVPPNQAHRAGIAKLLVHPDFRRRGLARRLMMAIEEMAKAEGRSLLTLDTRTGDAAEPLYAQLGFVRVGVIPRYSRHPCPEVPAGCDALEGATFFYKQL